MSIGLGKGVGIPVKLMHESEGHVITVHYSIHLYVKERGISSEFSLVVVALLLLLVLLVLLVLSKRDAKEREEERRQGKETVSF